jgi:hypothetical protein
MMRSQLSFILLISTVAARVEDGQLLPGLDRPVPDPTSVACIKETALLFDNQAIRNEIIRVDDQFTRRPYSDFCTLSLDDEFVCEVDWSKEFNSNLSQICEANGGAYRESAHEITCRASYSGSAGGFVFKHSNVPDCFGKDCEKADIERLLAYAVINMTLGYQTSLNMPCSSKYDFEDPIFSIEDPPTLTPTDHMEQDMENNVDDSGAGTTLWSLASLLPALLLLLLV